MTKIELADKAEHLIIKALDNIWQQLHQQGKTTTGDISPMQSLRLETLQRELAELIAEVIWQNVTEPTIQVYDFITVAHAGYGHKRITVHLLDGKTIYATTSDMRLVDEYDSENDNQRQEAKERLIAIALRAHGIDDFVIIK